MRTHFPVGAKDSARRVAMRLLAASPLMSAIAWAPLGHAAPKQACNEVVLQPVNLQSDDCFGTTAAIADDVLVIGAPTRDEGQSNGGAAYVFERNSDGSWAEVQMLTSGDPVTPGASAYGCAVATDGTHIFVQSKWHSAQIVPPGGSTVSVYEKQAGLWIRTQRLFDSQNTSGFADNFGVDIEVDGGRVFCVNVGRSVIHVFEKFSGQWSEVERITDAALGGFVPGGNATFAYTISVDGDRLAVTHNGWTDRVHILERGPSGWQATAQLLSGAPQVFFESPIALCGDDVFVGARVVNGQAGAVWVYRYIAGVWAHSQTVMASDSSFGADFGSSLAFDGERLIVGAPGDDTLIANAGSVYVFEDGGGGWNEARKVSSLSPLMTEYLGQSVQVQGDLVYAGARGDHVTYGGALYEFRVPVEIGVSFGEATTNSAGVPAVLRASGSPYVDNDCITFDVMGLPPAQFGYFLTSATQGYVPLFGGSEGHLFLALPIIRFNGSILISDSMGMVSFSPSLNNLPQGTVVLPGDTWSFQMWFRDTNPNPTSNTTNGLAITFATSGVPAVQFPSTLIEVEEEALQFSVTITLSQETDQNVSVPYSTSGSATHGVDWRIEESNPFIIPAGTASFEMTIVVAEDATHESNETGVVTLMMPTGGVLGTAPQFTLTIVDDD